MKFITQSTKFTCQNSQTIFSKLKTLHLYLSVFAGIAITDDTLIEKKHNLDQMQLGGYMKILQASRMKREEALTKFGCSFDAVLMLFG